MVGVDDSGLGGPMLGRWDGLCNRSGCSTGASADEPFGKPVPPGEGLRGHGRKDPGTRRDGTHARQTRSHARPQRGSRRASQRGQRRGPAGGCSAHHARGVGSFWAPCPSPSRGVNRKSLRPRVLRLWEAFLLQMNDFDRFLEVQLRKILDPVAMSPPPARAAPPHHPPTPHPPPPPAPPPALLHPP